MKKQRRKHTVEFKARVAIEAIRGVKTMSEIAADFEIHPIMVGNWKKEMLEHLPELFANKNVKNEQSIEKETAQLHRMSISVENWFIRLKRTWFHEGHRFSV